MVNVGLMVRLEAKPGKEMDVESFLRDQLTFAQGEPKTTAWFAMRLGPRTFAIFDAFPDESGRQAHLAGHIAEELKAVAPDLLKKPPTVEKIDVLAAKIPEHIETPDSLG